MKRILALIAAVAVCVALTVTCKKEAPMDFLISVNTGPLEVYPGMAVKSTFFKGKGPVKTDMVRLEGLSDSKVYEMAISQLGEDSFFFNIPQGFVEGKYSFNIKRGETVKFISNVTYTLKATDPSGDGSFQPAEGTTVYGRVACGSKGLAGVQVSDGYEVVMTDADGMYQIRSLKKNKYVFITVPSGYEVPTEGVQAMFFKHTSKSAALCERLDFTLYEAGDQTNHTVLFLGDMHLAGGKQNDRNQFKTFTSELNKYVSEHAGEKVYAITLGDMTWDNYWYDRNYCFAEYLKDMNSVKNLPVFHTMGNHDNDMKTSIAGGTAGWDAVDFDTADRYRTELGPTYYSINIGKVHYIVLDNIYCTNTTGGASGDRHYTQTVSSDNINWLKKDLSHVSKSTPIVVTMHANLYNTNGSSAITNGSELAACFSGYSDVRLVTGHTHKMWTVSKSNIQEYNSGAVCAAWWWAGYYNAGLNIAQDGAPAGYRVMNVAGTSLPSYFKGTGLAPEVQFRSYDLNETYMPQSQIASSKYFDDYSVKSSTNEVLINVWDYNDSWKVEVTENGRSLKVEQVTRYDPLFILAYVGKRYGTQDVAKDDISFGPSVTHHMFKVKASSATSTLEIKVTDDEGRTYTESMARPKAFTVDNYKIK